MTKVQSNMIAYYTSDTTNLQTKWPKMKTECDINCTENLQQKKQHI